MTIRDKPILKYVACHRGKAAGATFERRARGVRIPRGPLKGCIREGRSVFKVTRGCVLEFRVCIRVAL